MEYGSIEKEDIKPSAITPLLQYSITAKFIETNMLPQRLPFLGS
jgi:hypothetical protein